jgi:AcrR family transcriptional regulator
MKAASPLRERLREETTRAILTAGEDVFAEAGLHAAKVEAIAERAGVSVGTLYNYFKDRDGLLSALVEERAKDVEALIQRSATPTALFADRLRGFLTQLFGFFREHGRFIKIVIAGEHYTPANDPACQAPLTASIMNAIRDQFRSLVDDAVVRGELRSDDSAMFPVFIMGIARGVAMWSLRERGDIDEIETYVDAIVRFFMQGARS